jgi:threonine/homoserine/homoserine lactone efflux protein
VSWTIAACLLGLGAGASFGPVNLEITKVGLIGRAEEAMPLAFGAWSGDAVLLTVLSTLLAGASEAGAIDTTHLLVRAVAGAMIAAIAIRSLYRGPAIRDHAETTTRPTVAASKGVALSTLSPYGIVLWAGMGAAVIASGHSVLYGLGILLGDGAWFVVWLSLLRVARKRISHRAVRPIHFAANAALVVCAALLVLS